MLSTPSPPSFGAKLVSGNLRGQTRQSNLDALFLNRKAMDGFSSRITILTILSDVRTPIVESGERILLPEIA